MTAKLMNILETLGALLIVGAFTLWRGEYWKESNYLFWGAIALFTPVIFWKVWKKDWSERIVVMFLYGALLAIGLWWFGKKDLKVKIPYLPQITIQRN